MSTHQGEMMTEADDRAQAELNSELLEKYWEILRKMSEDVAGTENSEGFDEDEIALTRSAFGIGEKK